MKYIFNHRCIKTGFTIDSCCIDKSTNIHPSLMMNIEALGWWCEPSYDVKTYKSLNL